MKVQIACQVWTFYFDKLIIRYEDGIEHDEQEMPSKKEMWKRLRNLRASVFELTRELRAEKERVQLRIQEIHK